MKAFIAASVIFFALCFSFTRVSAPNKQITWTMPDCYEMVQKEELENGMTVEVWRLK